MIFIAQKLAGREFVDFLVYLPYLAKKLEKGIQAA